MELRYTGSAPEREIFQAFHETMEELFREDEKVVYLDADLMGSLKTQDLWRKYPQKVFNTGIQEANMVGVACGLYLAGYKPYIHSFAPFVSRRTFDQVFLSVGYAKKSVRIVGSDAGIMATDNGGTHMCFEDMAMMRAVPGACVVDVSDPEMFSFLLKATKDRPGLTYFRTARRNVPDIYPRGTRFEIGKGKILKEGNDVSIIASGVMAATALEAARLLEGEGIHARVADPVTVKPLDTELVRACAEETRAIVTAENHNVIGGLGSAVADYLSEACPTRVLRVGVQDSFGQVGPEAYLRDAYHLNACAIAEKARQALNRK